MNTLSVNFEYCFGIGKLKHDFEFANKQTNTFLIYAPNGTMKTSFAKTFESIAKNEPKNMPRDRVYVDRESKYDVLVDGVQISPENILVINAENDTFDASNKLSSFIASKDLKERYDAIYNDLEYQKTEFVKKLKAVSQSSDCEGEILGAFSESGRESFFDVIVRASEHLSDKFNKYEFKYNDIFDKKENVKKFLDKNEAVLDQYMSDYKILITNSKFFKETDGKSFGTYQASELLKSIEDNSFFEAGHKFVLEDGTEITDSQTLEDVVKAEIEKIVNDVKLKASFDKVDKAIAANVELRAFKRTIERDNLLLVELKNYDGFKKKVWISFLSQLKSDTELLVSFYLSKKAELEQIIAEAKKEVELWKQIITTFNARFYVPFTVALTNQDDIILKQQTANLEFHYSDGKEPSIRKERKDLLDVLSRGEKRAYFILQFLFEIESRKNSTDKNVLVFDDVADSFDYKNKYAIIEYIRDLRESDHFRMILLTHNFDFYRTVIARLYLYQPHEVYYLAMKNSLNEVCLSEGFNSRNVFEDFLGEIDQPKAFVSCIAFVRNVIEFVDSKKCEDYKKLTACLHLGESSKEITVADIFDIYKNRLNGLSDKVIDFGEQNIIDLIFKTADEIMQEENANEVDLYNKITLGIAVRLKAEQYLLGKLTDLGPRDHPNQTNYLQKKYKERFATSAALNVLDRVNLMTPENIHINAFMYEPLVDMSFYHLRDLYTDVKALD